MPSSPTITPLQTSLSPSEEEALAEWACPRWAKMRGASLRVGKLSLGGTGTFRLSNMGFGLGLAIGLEAAVQAASASSRTLGNIGGAAVFLFGSQLVGTLSGSSAAWRRAKSLGKGNLGAFSALGQRCAHSLIGHMTPNPVALAYIGLGAPLIATTLIDKALPKHRAFAKIHMASSAATVTLSAELIRWFERFKQFEDWKFSHLRTSALLDGSLLLADEIYSQLAMMRANSRWDAASAPDAKLRLSPTEAKSLPGLTKLVSAEANDQDTLIRCLETIQAAEIPSWHRPAPGMPDLTDLLLSLVAWQKRDFVDIDVISVSIDAMVARREAHELEASLSSISESATPRRLALRL